MPALPVHDVLYEALPIWFVIKSFLKTVKVGAWTVAVGSLFHILIVDGKYDLAVDTRRVWILGTCPISRSGYLFTTGSGIKTLI